MTLKQKIYRMLLIADEEGQVYVYGRSKGVRKIVSGLGKDSYGDTFKAIRRWENGGKNRYYKALANYIVASKQHMKVRGLFVKGERNISVY